MDGALKKVVEENWTQAEAAREFGITRTKLNVKVREWREAMDLKQQRSAVAIAERTTVENTSANPDHQRGLEVSNETRRIQPFPEFFDTYLAHTSCPDCGHPHPFPDFHKKMMEPVLDPAVKRLLVNCPPFHSKSTCVTVWSTVYELCRDPNSKTAIVSAGNKLAEQFLYQISMYLTDERVYEGGAGNLIQDWGPFQGDGKWRSNQLYIAGRTGASGQPSVASFGQGGKIYGIRPTRIILDDVADLQNQNTGEQVEKMFTWINQEPATRVGKNGKMILVGTRVANGDVYSLLEKLPGYHVVRFPCILDEDQGLTLWPDHFGMEAAKNQRDSMSHEQWQLVYQNVDTPGIGASFTPEMLELCHDPERTLGHFDPSWRMVLGVDPAGAGEQSGYTAMVILGIDNDGRRYLVDLVNVRQMKAPQIMQQIFDFAEQYPLREVRVETNGLQGQIFQHNVELQAKLTNRGIRLSPHITGKNKWDPQFGVEAMAPMFYNQMISIPWMQISDRGRLRTLEEQLMAFPMGKTTDLVMAMWFAELGVKDIVSHSNLPMFDPRFKAPGRILRNRKVIDFGEKQVLSPASAARQQGGRPMFPPAPASNPEGYVNREGVPTAA
jgi:hypothetical protein